jgi:hypothetical protein
MTKLRRTTFEVSRASEYFDARQLSALVGVSQDEFAGVCLKELVDNSLDACETSGVAPVVGVKATNGLGVTSVTGATPPLSADEGNARVQELIDQGMRADLAAAEVTKRMRVGG